MYTSECNTAVLLNSPVLVFLNVNYLDVGKMMLWWIIYTNNCYLFFNVWPLLCLTMTNTFFALKNNGPATDVAVCLLPSSLTMPSVEDALVFASGV